MLQDLSWLNNCSFGQLENIRKAIVERQMAKANDLAEEIRQDFDKNTTIIQDIDNQIKYIDNVGLSNTYKDVIREWRNWQYNINDLMKCKVNSATQLDSFRYYAHNCGLDGSLSCEQKLNEWKERFKEIVNGIQENYPDQYSNYLSKQDLKNRLSIWRQNNAQRILEIYNMLYENDDDLRHQMFTNANWNTIYQKFTNAIILSSWSIGSAEILKRDSWKNLTNQQIIDEIDKRTQAMYELCCVLRQQRQQSFYFNNNYDINNSISGFSNGYNNGYNNGQQQPY